MPPLLPFNAEERSFNRCYDCFVVTGESFPTTRSSAVLGARSDDEEERTRSWSALGRTYWKPAYKHLRIKCGLTPEDAEDAVQGFFECALEKAFFDAYEPSRARFRTFFRVCLERFAANEAKARRRQKRGGGAIHLALDAEEERYASAGELSDDVGRFLDGLPVRAHREGVFERAGRFVSRHRVVLSLLAAYLFVRLLIGLFLR
jgi:DNA-directed RNA polymerase specialized sigma24 family protein